MYKTTLKVELAKRGMRNEFLANKIGITESALSRLVNGKSLPTLRTAQKIAKVLEIENVSEIWPYEGDE